MVGDLKNTWDAARAWSRLGMHVWGLDVKIGQFGLHDLVSFCK